MKVLYLSGFHPVLEYDDCIMFDALGFEWFCTGIYLDPNNPLPYEHLNLRDPIAKPVNEFYSKCLSLFNVLNPAFSTKFDGMNRPKIVLNKEFVDQFDVIFATQVTAIFDNWEVLKHKSIVWRTVGAINPKMEAQMKSYVANGNVYPVRFSPMEFLTPGSNGGTYIRNYVDENLYKDWKNQCGPILSFQSWFTERRHLPINKAYIEFRKKVSGRCKLYGAFVGQKDPSSLGTVSWTKQRELYRDCLAYFYIGSPVAIVAYNFIEAMMTGCPILTLGPKIAGIPSPIDGNLLHEPSEFIQNGVNGFYSDNIDELAETVWTLSLCDATCDSISRNARETALKLFSKKRAIEEWTKFYKDTLK